MEPVYHLHLLGPIQVDQDGEPVRGFVSRKALALLGYLAVQRRPVSRSKLVYMFWPDKSEARGRGNLSRVLNNLSSLLPGCLEADYHSLQIQPMPGCWLDLATFEELFARDDIDALTSAADLYRGDLMADLYLDDCPDFETWLMSERERWQQRAVQVLRRLIDHHTQYRQYEQAIDFASRLLAWAPWLEEAHRHMMSSLARSGQRSAALAQYRTCCRLLAEELGVEPSAETVALYERIRAAGSPPHHNLSAQPTPFVGREAELAELSRLLENANCRLLTIFGPGGIGKTRLALQAASQVTSQGFVVFLNGVYFVSLDGIDSDDLVPSTIADVLKLPLYGAIDPKIQLLNYLRDKEMLLILDNFERLLGITGLLVDILQQAPDVKLIVTSRVRLNLRWEWLLDLHGLDVPRFEDLDDSTVAVEKHSALRLFAGTAGRVKRSFSLAQDRSCATRICQLVEGLPLGIELAAAGVRERSCEAIAAEIEHNLDSLSTSLQDLPARHRSMRAVFDYSCGFLSDQERAVFRRLSVFRGGFELDAAHQVADATPGLLSALVRKSFLRQDASDRYDMHELLRQYATEKLKNAAEEHQETHRRHCAYFADFIGQRTLRSGTGQKQTLVEIEVELRNIRAGWQWAVEQGEIEEINKSADAFWEYYEVRGRFNEGKAAFEHAPLRLKLQSIIENSPKEDINSRTPHYTLGLLLSRQSWFCWRLGSFSEAREMLRGALTLLRHAGPGYRSEAGFCIWQLGVVAWYLGEYVEAKTYFQEGLAIGREINDWMLVLSSLHHLGLVAQAQGSYPEARQLLQESYEISREFDQMLGMEKALICWGYLVCLLKEYSQAGQFLREGLRLTRELKDMFGVGLGLCRLGNLMYEMQQYGEAKQLYQESLATYDAIGDKWGIALSLTHLGYATCALSEYQEAERHLHRALTLAMEIGVMPVALAALVGIANLLLTRGEQKRTLELLAVVLGHPASEQETKDRAEQLLSELEDHLPRARAMVQARIRGKVRRLEDIVEEILRG
jgi:predicted ATPase/DNA-binding SARP family transcriptional activator